MPKQKKTEHLICDTKQTRKLMATAILPQVIQHLGHPLPHTQNQGQKEITAMVVNTECKTVTKKVMAHMLLLTLRQHQTIIHTTITSRESRKNYLPCPTILI